MNTPQSIKKQFVKALGMTFSSFTLLPILILLFGIFYLQESRSGNSYDMATTLIISMLLLIGLGVFIILVILGLGGVAFSNRKLQYFSFTFGWKFIVFFCFIELLIQGSLAIILSGTVTILLFNAYIPRLIIVVVFAVLAGLFYVIKGMFKKIPQNNEIPGQIITRADAPALWERVDRLAKKLKTKSPNQIIVGIDTNFFVTQAPMTLNGQNLKGRTLYISLPLLSRLTEEEADGVLAHELSHLREGDTLNSAKLGPKLIHCDMYIASIRENTATKVVYYPLRFYRLIFELALQRESRQREYMADASAAKAVSARAIIHSLIKIEAYACYRTKIENQLFEHDHRHEGNISIHKMISEGLHDYALSHGFLKDMESGHIPHPFDSHPSLIERMKNVNYTIPTSNYAHVVTWTAEHTWLDSIPNAAQIEKKMWHDYEQDFEKNHEQMLAYTLDPTDEEQKQIVLDAFPDQVFELKKGQHFKVTYQGMFHSNGKSATWDNVKDLQYNDGWFSDSLIVVLKEKQRLGNKSVPFKLPGIKKQRNALKNILGVYWERGSIAAEMQARKNIQK